MEPTRQQIVDDIIHDAHYADERIVTREVSRRIVDELRNLEASGVRWAAEVMDAWLLYGIERLCANWREATP